jgi:zinc transporter, ZIP family
MAFGVGVLISAIAFELAEEAFHTAGASFSLALGLGLGALTFFAGDMIINRMGGHHRKHSEGNENSSPTGIVLGSILDGIPESIVIGLGIARGGAVGAAMLIAVFLSNLPEAIGATSGMLKNKWRRLPLIGMWLLVVAVSGVASLAGFSLFDTASPDVVAFTLAFSAGALLTMLADTMMPEAYKDTGPLAGLVTTLGFGIAFWVSMFE